MIPLYRAAWHLCPSGGIPIPRYVASLCQLGLCTESTVISIICFTGVIQWCSGNSVKSTGVASGPRNVNQHFFFAKALMESFTKNKSVVCRLWFSMNTWQPHDQPCGLHFVAQYSTANPQQPSKTLVYTTAFTSGWKGLAIWIESLPVESLPAA